MRNEYRAGGSNSRNAVTDTTVCTFENETGAAALSLSPGRRLCSSIGRRLFRDSAAIEFPIRSIEVSGGFRQMGILRLLLAFFVVIGHSHSIYGYAGMGGAAVPAFFIISGFYMTLILETKYRGSDQLWLFYSNRVLRLFPLYWFFVLIYFALAVVPMWRAQPPILQILVTANRSVGFALDGSIASILAIIPSTLR